MNKNVIKISVNNQNNQISKIIKSSTMIKLFKKFE